MRTVEERIAALEVRVAELERQVAVLLKRDREINQVELSLADNCAV